MKFKNYFDGADLSKLNTHHHYGHTTVKKSIKHINDEENNTINNYEHMPIRGHPEGSRQCIK